MSWLDKLERRYGHLYIPQLMNLIVAGQAVAWAVIMFLNQNLYYALMLNRTGLEHFQLWRLVSFVFVPPLESPLYLLIELYFLWFLGAALERTWGGFAFNLYFFAGMLGAIVSCLLVGYGSASTLFLSLFLAYACLYPDMQVLLFFFIPVKVKWMGYVAGGFWVLQLIISSWAGRVNLLLGMSGFLLFFGREMWQIARGGYVNRRRRKQWKDQWRNR